MHIFPCDLVLAPEDPIQAGQPDFTLPPLSRASSHYEHLQGPRGPLSNAGVDVKMVGREVLTLIVQTRLGGGPRGSFQQCVTAVRTGACE